MKFLALLAVFTLTMLQGIHPQPEPNSCPAVKCTQACDEFVLDEHGCQSCECKDLCDDVVCKNGLSCSLVLRNCSDCPPVAMCLNRFASYCDEGQPLRDAKTRGTHKCHMSNKYCPGFHECMFFTKSTVGWCCPKPKPADCPLIQCSTDCFAYKVNDQGCRTCECDDLCEGVQCEYPDETCQQTRLNGVSLNNPTSPMCLPFRDNYCLAGQPFIHPQSKGIVKCSAENGTCPNTHHCQYIEELGYGVCCSEPHPRCPRLKCSKQCKEFKVGEDDCPICECKTLCDVLKCEDPRKTCHLIQFDCETCPPVPMCLPTEHYPMPCHRRISAARDPQSGEFLECSKEEDYCPAHHYCTTSLSYLTEGWCCPNERNTYNCSVRRCSSKCFAHKFDAEGCETCECEDLCEGIECEDQSKTCKEVTITPVLSSWHRKPQLGLCLSPVDKPCHPTEPLLDQESSEPVLCSTSNQACPASHYCHVNPDLGYGMCCSLPQDEDATNLIKEEISSSSAIPVSGVLYVTVLSLALEVL